MNESGTEIFKNIQLHGYLCTELTYCSLLRGDLKIHRKLQFLLLPICKCLETSVPFERNDVDRGRIRSVLRLFERKDEELIGTLKKHTAIDFTIYGLQILLELSNKIKRHGSHMQHAYER
jgi:hypothetical protein